MEKYVSLIIPVYNVELYLNKLFECLEKQDYLYFEVIFVNDGSSDNSLQMLKKFCTINPTKYKIISKVNGGLNPARKTGIDNAQYDLIMFADSDDYFNENYISSLVNEISDEIDMVCAPFFSVDENGILISKLNDMDCEKVIWSNDEALEKILSCYELGNHFPAKLYKKHLFDNVDFSYRFPFEDFTISHIIVNNAKNVCKVNKPTYFYVKHQGTLSAKTKSSYLSCINAILIRRKWIEQNKIFLIKIVDCTLFDRFIQMVSQFYLTRNHQTSKVIKKIYRSYKNKKVFNTYTNRNIKFYFFSPLIYYLIKMLKCRCFKFTKRENYEEK